MFEPDHPSGGSARPNVIRGDDAARVRLAEAGIVTSTSMAQARPLTLPGALGAIALVAGVAAITGTLTPYASTHLPGSINSVANSSGPWAMIAFASVYLSRARGLFAALLGATSFLVMNVFFFVAFERRLGPYSLDAIGFWIGVGIVVGPIIGLCASWLRSPATILREIGVAAPGSVLIGEGLFMVIEQPGLSPAYAHASVVVGIVLFLALAVWRLGRIDRVLISAALCTAFTVAFYLSYSLMPLLFNRSAP